MLLLIDARVLPAPENLLPPRRSHVSSGSDPYLQVIDYTTHSPVSTYLAKHFSPTPFSAIIDAYGIQDIFTHCESYLAEGKPFVTVGIAFKDYAIPSVLSAVFQMMSNTLWPWMLGGVKRDYVQVTGIANLEAMAKLAGLVESGKLRVVRDGEWGMGDALKVSWVNAVVR